MLCLVIILSTVAKTRQVVCCQYAHMCHLEIHTVVSEIQHMDRQIWLIHKEYILCTLCRECVIEPKTCVNFVDRWRRRVEEQHNCKGSVFRNIMLCSPLQGVHAAASCWLLDWLAHTHIQKVGLTAGPCTVTYSDLLCILPCFNPSTLLHFKWNAGFFI
jgi:hypothetical protein